MSLYIFIKLYIHIFCRILHGFMPLRKFVIVDKIWFRKMSECYNYIGKTKNLYEYLGLEIILLKSLFISKCTVVIIHCNLLFLVKVFDSVILLITFLFNFPYMVLVYLLLKLHCLFNCFKMFLTLFTGIPNSVIWHWPLEKAAIFNGYQYKF